jgi:polysaccharide export outer membrane protein
LNYKQFLRWGWYPEILLVGRIAVRVCVATLVAAALCGCSILPSDGPKSTDVFAKADVTVGDASSLGYAVVRLTPGVVSVSRSIRSGPALSAKAVAPPADVKIGYGDFVTVTIFEAGAGGLFIPVQAGARPGNFITLPPQQIDQAGSISVPYAGAIQAVGRSVADIQREIEQKLANRAIEPQVVVSLGERRANDVSVLGEVNKPDRFPLDPGGIKLLGAIARAGGPRYPAHESLITLQRRGQTYQVTMTSMVRDPSQNVNLVAGDVVYISREPKYFLALGGTGPFNSLGGSTNRRIPFDDDNLTLADGVAKAGGLHHDRSDSRSVFLYRQEDRRILERLGVDLTNIPPNVPVPTIYTVDLRQPDGFFLANEFFLHDRDILFVSDAPSVDLLRFMQIVRSITAPIADLAVATHDVTGAIRDIQLINRGQ